MDHPIVVALYLVVVGAILSVIGLVTNCLSSFSLLDSVRDGAGVDSSSCVILVIGNVFLAIGVGFIVAAVRIVRRR